MKILLVFGKNDLGVSWRGGGKPPVLEWIIQPPPSMNVSQHTTLAMTIVLFLFFFVLSNKKIPMRDWYFLFSTNNACNWAFP